MTDDATTPAESTGTTSRVVVGVKRHQPYALTFAIAEANRRHEAMRVVHAIWMPSERRTDEKGERLRANGKAVLETGRRFIEQAPAAPSVEYALRTESPVSALMDESRSASCLVVGTDDVPWFERLIGGEVARWLVRHAGCPVFVVPENVVAPSPSWSDVVVAVDLDTVSAGLLRAAFEEAELRHARVRVLHAVAPRLAKTQADHAHAVVDGLVARAMLEHPAVRVVTNVVTDEADDACLRASEHAGLLVLGRPRPVEQGSLIARPVAGRVLRAARCPVLVTRDQPAG
ncbi:hypothetical protein GEV29_15245 [Aeromicrobium sp. SMF47]|uniref:universal stress protein n=1 Tax=Aeromicrobium yanjiei TaxID=2662028 RepID=UPI00129E665D|nr:universal stress protein [Aeromicrobium yanjiei]MRJ77897.1 hypothetical protein [Aeromicrobium yanjiei]